MSALKFMAMTIIKNYARKISLKKWIVNITQKKMRQRFVRRTKSAFAGNVVNAVNRMNAVNVLTKIFIARFEANV